MRIWLDQMLRQSLGQVVDWAQVDREDYLLAMARSPIRDIDLKYYLSRALTDQVDSLAVYCCGLDASWAYEGESTYRAWDLVEAPDE